MSTAASPEHRVARVSELDPAPSMRPFEIDGRKGLLVRLPDGLHAVSGLCPHAQAPLHEGALSGTRLVCPWHQSVFDVSTGALLDPPSLDGLERFGLRVDGDDVFVRLPAPVPAPARAAPSTDARTVLIAGAGAAAQVAAEALRREGFGGRIVMVGPEPEVPYDRTNLSKHFLSGKAGREDLPLRRDPGCFERVGVERRIAAVSHLDAPEKIATFSDGETLRYDAAILATGGIPKQLELPGADGDRVCYLRTVADVEKIIGFAPGHGSRAVAVGASFIGLEAVSSLAQRGVQVTVLLKDEVPFEKTLGREVGRSIRRLHERNGVRFIDGATVARFDGTGRDLAIVLEDGRRLSAEVAIVGVGVRPATDYLSGIERTEDGGIAVDGTLHAAHDLYAVGDIARFPLGTERGVRIEHWRVAQQHAVLAARNIARPEERRTLVDHGFVPFFWTYHFEQRMNFVGHAPRWDEVILDGDPEAPPFLAYYVLEGQVIAAAGTHRDADLAAMHELLRRGLPPTAAQVRAGGFSPGAASR